MIPKQRAWPPTLSVANCEIISRCSNSSGSGSSSSSSSSSSKQQAVASLNCSCPRLSYGVRRLVDVEVGVAAAGVSWREDNGDSDGDVGDGFDDDDDDDDNCACVHYVAAGRRGDKRRRGREMGQSRLQEGQGGVWGADAGVSAREGLIKSTEKPRISLE